MIILDILKNIILAPLELVFEIIFSLALKITHSEGIAIIIMSLVVSTLVLPLYKRAEKLEAEERKKEKELSHWATHIKKHFKGDEKYMTLDAYYREKHYSPIYQLRSSISILLQIPFFTAAYEFLGVRATERFSEVGFFVLSNLGEPDKLFSIGNITVNALPILMTLVNILACYIYTKHLPFKSSIKSYLLALLFMVLLYDCPSALLLYWTMNNVYSLFKTIIIKNAESRKVAKQDSNTVIQPKQKNGKAIERFNSLFDMEPGKGVFALATIFMSILTGLLIPLSYLSASPEEFISVTNPLNPLHYLISSFFVAFGFFVFWPGVFYFLANKKTKVAFSMFMFGVSVFSVFNYLVYSKETGMINTSLVFDKDPSYSISKILINTIIVLAIFAGCYFVYRFRKALVLVFLASILSVMTLSFINARKIQATYDHAIDNFDDFQRESAPKILLSSEGKNVIVIMLDRAVSGYIPYAVNECPELKEQLDGFVYYPNTLAFGQNTLVTSSALFGGYEYTPERMDLRDNETLVEKHDEALKVMPKVFSEKGYNSTLMDLPFPGWSWNGNYSSFKDIENCDSYYAKDYYNSDTELNVNNETRRNRNLFLYSIFRCSPLCLQGLIYDKGNYLSIGKDDYNKYDVLENYKVLENLDDMTQLTNEYSGSLFLIDNETAHDIFCLRDFNPYTPRDFEGEYSISNGANDLLLWHKYQAGCYECLVASLKGLGDYFDYLREIGVYDNTRIIIVSDHATEVKLFEDLVSPKVNAEWYNCLLMVKDFDSTGFTVDDTFMTNADVPTIAFKGLVNQPVNPYTGKIIDSRQKNGDIYVNYSRAPGKEYLWNPDYNNGNVFDYGDQAVWFKVINRNIFVKDNWVEVDKPTVESD